MSLKVYWYKCGSKHGNFGDCLTPLLLEYFNVPHYWAPAAHADLIGVGSVCEHIPAGFTGAIWSSGNLFADYCNHFEAANVLALRGGLTLGHTAGYGFATALPPCGDGGLLCHLLAPSVHKRFKLGVIPHYIHADVTSFKELAASSDDICYIDICDEPHKVLYDVGCCENILSSSLHGLVVADSLGIPNRWVYVDGRVLGGGFKFRDYYSVFDMECPKPVTVSATDSLDTMLPWFEGYERPGIEAVKERLLEALKVFI